MRSPLGIVGLAALAALLGGGGPTSGRWRGQALGVCWEGSPRPIEAGEVEALVACGVGFSPQGNPAEEVLRRACREARSE